MVRSARARPKGRRSHSAPQDLDATALRLDSTLNGRQKQSPQERWADRGSSRIPVPCSDQVILCILWDLVKRTGPSIPREDQRFLVPENAGGRRLFFGETVLTRHVGVVELCSPPQKIGQQDGVRPPPLDGGRGLSHGTYETSDSRHASPLRALPVVLVVGDPCGAGGHPSGLKAVSSLLVHEGRTEETVGQRRGLSVPQSLLVSARTHDASGYAWSVLEIGSAVAASRTTLDLVTQVEPREWRRTPVEVVWTKDVRPHHIDDRIRRVADTASRRTEAKGSHVGTRSPIWSAGGGCHPPCCKLDAGLKPVAASLQRSRRHGGGAGWAEPGTREFVVAASRFWAGLIW